MINIRTLKKIVDNGGLTLKNGRPIVYKSGWQVATEGIETTDMREAISAIKAYNGNCGIWFAGGVWYIDRSHRVNTKREAMEIGRACNQISVLRWRDMGLVYCQTPIKKFTQCSQSVHTTFTFMLYSIDNDKGKGYINMDEMRFFIEWTDNFEGWDYSENVSVNELLDRQLDDTLTITFVGMVDKDGNVGEDLPDLHEIILQGCPF